MNCLPLGFAFAAVAAVQAAAAPEAEGRFALSGRMEQGGLVHGSAPPGTVRLTFGGKPVPLAADGRFLIGFDRDQPQDAELVVELGGGREVRETLRIAPRVWRTQHVNAARRPRIPSADYLRIRQAELARIAAAREAEAESEGWRQRFLWPAEGRISGRFGAQRIYRGEPGAYHSGVDVAAGAGAPVVAPADGIVVLAGPPSFSLEGNLVLIAHGMGLNSAFLHLEEAVVRQGQKVRQGQLIGRVGASGRATGPHLHWSMKWKHARIDPEAVAGPIRP